jgi:NDP-sugar pyrophosphorylase family protein
MFYVVFPAGGDGLRISNLTHQNMHKSCLEINNKSLLELSLDFWINSSFKIKDILILVKENYSSLIEEMKKEKYEKIKDKINFSIELEKLGKGGALLKALKNFKIEDNDVFIIHNPDDIILKDYADKIIASHLSSKADITIVGVKNIQSPYTSFRLNEKNLVRSIEIKPLLLSPSHIGITLINGNFLKKKIQENDSCVKFDFEEIWFEECINSNKLSFFEIDTKDWIAVNDSKAFYNLQIKMMLD